MVRYAPWPLVVPPSQPFLDDVAAWGLAAPPTTALETESFGGWRQMVTTAHAARMPGLLAKTLADGYWQGADIDASMLHESLRDRLTMDLVAERRALIVTDHFTRHGIRHVIFKGVAYAHGREVDPGCRHFDDVDVVVHGSDFPRAKTLLDDLGARRLYPEPRPGFDERFGKGASYISDELGAIDLHRMVATGWAGARLDEAGLLENVDALDLGGRKIPVMEPITAALVTCVRVVAGGSAVTAREMRDAALAWQVPGVSHIALINRATDVQLGAMLAAGVRNTVERLGLVSDDPLIQWSMTYVPTKRELVRLAPYTPDGWSYPRQLSMQLRDMPGLKNKARFFVGVALPARASGRAPMRKRIGSATRDLLGARERRAS